MDVPYAYLSELRAEIDEVDTQIVALLERRMDIVTKVAEYKTANGVGVRDSAREAEVLADRAAKVKNPLYRESCLYVIEKIMEASRRYQSARAARTSDDKQGDKGT